MHRIVQLRKITGKYRYNLVIISSYDPLPQIVTKELTFSHVSMQPIRRHLTPRHGRRVTRFNLYMRFRQILQQRSKGSNFDQIDTDNIKKMYAIFLPLQLTSEYLPWKSIDYISALLQRPNSTTVVNPEDIMTF